MLVIFPILFCFSFFIWSCSVLMMQIVRCESAVAQGLRSDTLQATKKAESASMRPPHPPHSLWPLCCGPLPTHNQPRSQMPPNLRHNWLKKKQTKQKQILLCLVRQFSEFYVKCLLAVYFQMPHVIMSQCSHWLIPQSPQFPLYSEVLYGCWAYASLVWQVFCQGLLVCSSLIWPFSERSGEAQWPLPRARSRKQHNMVNCGDGGNRHTPRTCVCCACITGTITCTNGLASQVVRYYAHIRLNSTAFVDIFDYICHKS